MSAIGWHPAIPDKRTSLIGFEGRLPKVLLEKTHLLKYLP